MKKEVDFNIFKAQILEEIKAGKPLFGKDGALAPMIENIYTDKSEFMEINNRPNPNEAFPNPKIPSLCFIKNVVRTRVSSSATIPTTMMWMVLTSSRSMSLISTTS